MNKGLVHLYEGDGKGKTTAAMGLCLRALGRGKRVVIVQFLKGASTGEIALLEQLGASVFRGKSGDKFVFQMSETEKTATRTLQNQNLQSALALDCDLLLLDEACAVLSLGMIDEALLQSAVLAHPPHREVVLTGRNPAQWMCDVADYHTEMVCHRHPYHENIPAREGIEF